MELFATGNALRLALLNKLHWTIAESATDVGNVGAGEDDLVSLTIPAGLLSVNGDSVRYRTGGVLGANGNTKTIKFYYGGTSLGTNLYSSTGNALGWFIDFRITRTGATTARLSGLVLVGGTSVSVFATSITITWANANILKCTGESGASASNDVVQHGALITAMPGV